MNILLIDHNAGSPVLGMEYRPYYLARQWVREGHRVRIIAASYAHRRVRQPSMRGIIDRQGFDGIEYVFLKTPSYEGHGWARIVNILAFVSQLYARVRDLCTDFKPDIVIAASGYPFDMGPAHLIARYHGAKLVYGVSELWPDSPVQLWGLSRNHPFVWLAAWGQRQACRVCDTVVSILPKADEFLRGYGLKDGLFHHIPNGIEPDEWADDTRAAGIDSLTQTAIDCLRAQGRMIIGYAGTHGVSNDLKVLVDAAALSRDLPVGFVCVGEGPERRALADYAVERGVADNFLFCGALPKRQVPRFLRQMDVLYMGLKHVDVHRYGVSFNKIYDYMMAGKPIIMAVDAGNDMLADVAGSVSVPSGRPQDVANAIKTFAGMAEGERNAFGAETKAHVLLNNAYPVLARQFLEAVQTA